jgi:hypothetical protein
MRCNSFGLQILEPSNALLYCIVAGKKSNTRGAFVHVYSQKKWTGL